jgi:hypothetical protein
MAKAMPSPETLCLGTIAAHADASEPRFAADHGGRRMRVMTALPLVVLLSLTGIGTALAQSATAYEHANCHASFMGGCSNDTSANVASEAPLPLLGASPLAILALGATVAAIRRRRKAAKAIAAQRL